VKPQTTLRISIENETVRIYIESETVRISIGNETLRITIEKLTLSITTLKNSTQHLVPFGACHCAQVDILILILSDVRVSVVVKNVSAPSIKVLTSLVDNEILTDSQALDKYKNGTIKLSTAVIDCGKLVHLSLSPTFAQV